MLNGAQRQFPAAESMLKGKTTQQIAGILRKMAAALFLIHWNHHQLPFQLDARIGAQIVAFVSVDCPVS
jgi:hypothetical protein